MRESSPVGYPLVMHGEAGNVASRGNFRRLPSQHDVAIVKAPMSKCVKSSRRPITSNLLWKYRRRMGFTQQQVAELIGYHSRTDISHYEHGDKLPSLVTGLKLEIVCRIPVAFLFPELYGRLKTAVRAREEKLRAEWGKEKRR